MISGFGAFELQSLCDGNVTVVKANAAEDAAKPRSIETPPR